MVWDVWCCVLNGKVAPAWAYNKYRSSDSTNQSAVSFWRVNSRITSYFFKHVREEVVALHVPGLTRKTVRISRHQKFFSTSVIRFADELRVRLHSHSRARAAVSAH